MHAAATIFADSPAFQPFATPRANTIDNEGQRIRHAAADLFRQGRIAEADVLTHAAMQHHPYSEDVLVMRALICEVQHDWKQASAALERLLDVQGQDAPAATWSQWIRVLRCAGELTKARQTIAQALQLHPHHAQLTHELTQLESLGHSDVRQAA